MSKEIRISNGVVEAVISSKAAEVISFKSVADPVEMVWCRNPEHWYNCNPVLFPITGPVEGGKYVVDGKEYTMGNHGFARGAEFEIEEITETSAVLSLTYSDTTLALYPFKFKLSVRYSLEGARINLDYTVENLDERELPFMIGFHPAFNIPMTPDKTYDDYWVVFPNQENLSVPENDFGTGNKVRVVEGMTTPAQQFFYYNNQLCSPYVDLTDGKHTLRVGKEGFATLGLWRKTDHTPFLCIEPWHPANNLKKGHLFGPSKENNLLPANETFNCSYFWEII